MKRIMLEVAYDGTNYYGWQIQPNEITIESVLNEHLSRLLKEEIKVIGASRTDSGVHALGNVAVFDTHSSIPGERMSYALNRLLPKDITIQNSKEVSSDFHPRYSNSIKTYEYRILNSEFPIPTQRLYSYFVKAPLDIDLMKLGAGYLVGSHDFKSFCSSKSQVKSTVRTIYGIKIEKKADLITIRISGNGFLYNMVRIIAGTLIKVGHGAYSPEKVKEILEMKDRTIAGPNAPACGLTLVGIQYLG